MICNIYKYDKNSKSNWLLIISDDIVFLCISETDVLYIPEKHLSRCSLEKIKENYDLFYVDKMGFKITFEKINTRTVSRENAIEFLKSIKNISHITERKLREIYDIDF